MSSKRNGVAPKALIPSAFIHGSHDELCSMFDTAIFPWRKEKKCAAVFMPPVVLLVNNT
jgi:hypothetical protein